MDFCRYTHKRTGTFYFKLFEVHDVTTQRPYVVYLNERGQRFCQDKELFDRKFILDGGDPNKELQPTKPKLEDLEQMEMFVTNA